MEILISYEKENTCKSNLKQQGNKSWCPIKKTQLLLLDEHISVNFNLNFFKFFIVFYGCDTDYFTLRRW